MICKWCAVAADHAAARPGAPKRQLQLSPDTLHRKCRGGTWCDCQHRETPRTGEHGG